ncbi:MAG: hypothetical protein ACRDYY_09995 [Acidimicrobiales bacterium]
MAELSLGIPWAGYAVRDLQRPAVHLILVVGAPLLWALLCMWSIWRPVMQLGRARARARARRGAHARRGRHATRQAQHR